MPATTTTAPSIDAGELAHPAPLTDDQRVTLTDTLLWAFREEAEAVVEHIAAACDGDVGSAHLEDCQARFAAMTRLAELLDGLPAIGWSSSSYGAYRAEYVALRMTAEREAAARHADLDAGIRNAAPAGHVVIADDMVEEMSLAATRALLQIGTNVRGMEADVDAIVAVAPELARWTRIRAALTEREPLPAADAYECWTYCSPAWIIELGADREAEFVESLRAAGAELDSDRERDRAAPSLWQQEAEVSLAASTALRGVAAGLQDEDVRLAMVEQAQHLELFAGMRGVHRPGGEPASQRTCPTCGALPHTPCQRRKNGAERGSYHQRRMPVRSSEAAVDAAKAWERSEDAMVEAAVQLHRLAIELVEDSLTRAGLLARAEHWQMLAEISGAATSRPWSELWAYANLACEVPDGLRVVEAMLAQDAEALAA